jgi:hypothetical protein
MSIRKFVSTAFNLSSLVSTLPKSDASDSDHDSGGNSDNEFHLTSFPTSIDSTRKTRATATTIGCSNGPIKGGYLLHKTSLLIRDVIDREIEVKNNSVSVIDQGISWLRKIIT